MISFLPGRRLTAGRLFFTLPFGVFGGRECGAFRIGGQVIYAVGRAFASVPLLEFGGGHPAAADSTENLVPAYKAGFIVRAVVADALGQMAILPHREIVIHHDDLGLEGAEGVAALADLQGQFDFVMQQVLFLVGLGLLAFHVDNLEIVFSGFEDLEILGRLDGLIH